MIVTKLDIVDWEPCHVSFIFATKAPISQELLQFIEAWLKGRSALDICGCRYRYAEFSNNPVERVQTLQTEWICETCVQYLADAVKGKFPDLQRVELGMRHDVEEQRPGEFVRIPEKTVEFEDGVRTPVGAFSIAKRPVTIGEFERFARANGYVTSAERRHSPETFRNHSGLSGLAPSLQAQVPVQFINRNDAEAFCAETGFRLPTEAEWLAAAVGDFREVDVSPLQQLQRRTRQPSGIIEVKNWDITSTVLPSGLVVSRRGPVEFVQKGWREEPLLNFHRRLIRPDEHDMSITFRIVRDE